MTYMLLVRFWSKEGFKKPATVCDLMYLPKFFESSDDLLHDGNLLWSILFFLHGNWRRVPGVDHAFVVFDRDEDSLLIEYGPVFFNKIVDAVAGMRVELG